MEDFRKAAEFRNLLRTALTELLLQSGYQLTYDNEKTDQNKPEHYVFRLHYSGNKKIQIFNDDWRDYTEYFSVKLDEEELMILKLTEFEDVWAAFEEIKRILVPNL
ncbi:MAG TPA: hypothetical protein VM935_16955 [Chitinophagaceae bacterium]|jgi:hypothetical protein|nr:hypothetical protein [Chitinophagaceae bacterium]